MQRFLPRQFKDLETLSHGWIPGPSMVLMNCNRVATRVASMAVVWHSTHSPSLHPWEGLLLVTHTQYFHQLIVRWSKWLTNGWCILCWLVSWEQILLNDWFVMMKLVTWQSRWIWQYWINEKSYTWDDVEFITSKGIDIESESLDHCEDICLSRQSSHRIDVLELHRHVSSHVPRISGACCRRNAMFFFIVTLRKCWNFVS